MDNRIPVTSKMCMTRDVGTHGNLFGGNMLGWMDEAAAIYARKQTGANHVVTVKFTEVIFKYVVKVGEIVEFSVSNSRIGNTSITFDLEGYVGETMVVRTEATFVAVDEQGRPTVIRRG
ncbi:MAG: hotdog domain-containing protein [Candidatus Electryonea clarkiae]|nr:hotdog domain-containing protein [Candidatus Electryonea clarkiae]MDP8287777.1 hotdog domain-containing protein [Candidatus Electryonea clarkiae]